MALNTLKAVKGVILVFDVTMKSSFESVTTWMKEIEDNLNEPCLVLFGNKIDKDKNLWEVSEEEAKEFAEQNKLPYFKTSAKTKQGINEGISYIVNKAYEKINGIKNENDNVIILGKTEDENENNNNNSKEEEEVYETKTGCFGKKVKKKRKVVKKDKKKSGEKI